MISSSNSLSRGSGVPNQVDGTLMHAMSGPGYEPNFGSVLPSLSTNPYSSRESRHCYAIKWSTQRRTPLQVGSAFAIAVASLFIPSARFAVNAVYTSVRYISAFSPLKTIRCVSLVLPPVSPSSRHSNDRVAPSSRISIVAALGGVTSRMNQCSSCPGIRVVPCDPAANGPFNANSAGGSSQFVTSVQKFQAKAGLASVSTE